jgi:hypothetical protein
MPEDRVLAVAMKPEAALRQQRQCFAVNFVRCVAHCFTPVWPSRSQNTAAFFLPGADGS